jgi:FkbM family methyltransferase
MNTSRLRSLLEPVTPPIVRRIVRGALFGPGIAFRNWQRGLGDKSVDCHARGITVSLGVSSEMERFRARTFATKEPETLAWLDASLGPDDVFFDVGANVGVYTLYASKRCPRSRIYAFEPEAQNYARLCRNVYMNDCANVVPCNLAVCGKTGFGLFEVRRLEAGAALHGMAGVPTLDPNGLPPITRQGVGTVILDTLVSDYGLPQPTLIKVDVDGVEEQIFEGAERVLANRALKSVLVEINIDPKGPSPIELCLERHGFRLTEKSKWTGRFGNVEGKNYIYSRLGPT